MPSRGGITGEFISPYKINVTYGDKSAGIARGSGADWFGPMDPIAPVAPPEVASRQWDFPAGFNLNLQPRVMEPVSFPLLRGFADSYDILRLIIETRKDQVARLNWSVKPRDETSANANDPLVAQVTNFLRRPDGVHPFADWLRMLLEDLFVIDAPTLYMQRTYGGKLLALQPLDGATIKPVVDDWGRTPQPYEENGETIYPVAYQQVLKGFPAIDYSVDDVLYRPRNIRTHHAYGFSPVEQILTTVNIALRRQIFTLEYFTSGNIPDSLIGMPESWTPEQIANYQKYWDAYIEGDLAARRRAKFVPGGVAKTFIQTKEPELKGEFDEWLARICCFAFSISPQALTRQMNRASAETQKEIAEEEGLWPVLNWAKQLLDDVIEREFSAPHLEFAWGQDQQIDPAQQAVILSTYVKSGVLTINEARAQLGMAPLSEPAANTALTLTANGYVGIGAGADAANQLARAPVIPQAHPSTGALTRAAQDEDLERAAHLSRTNPLVLSDRRNPSSLTVSLSNREGRSSLDKYSPDQPRVPAGHSDGGEWTSGGADAQFSGSTVIDAHGATSRSPIESFLAPGVSAQALEGLEEYATRSLLAAGGAPALAFGLMFVPSQIGGGPVSGEIPGRSDLSYTWIPDQGLFVLLRQIDGKDTAVLAAQLAPGGVYVDHAGDPIARYLGGKLIVDSDAVDKAAADAGASSDTQTTNDKPKLCPEPTPDKNAPKDEEDALKRWRLYQSAVTGLPVGLAILYNDYIFDGCREIDGVLIEAKGYGFAGFMNKDGSWKWWFTQKGSNGSPSGLEGLEAQIRNQYEASGVRLIEYHVAEKVAADKIRELVGKLGYQDKITVIWDPRPDLERRK